MANLNATMTAPDEGTIARDISAMPVDFRNRLTRMIEDVVILSPDQARLGHLPPVQSVVPQFAQPQFQNQTGVIPRGPWPHTPLGPWATPQMPGLGFPAGVGHPAGQPGMRHPWAGKPPEPDPNTTLHPLAEALWPLLYSHGYAQYYDGEPKPAPVHNATDPAFAARFVETMHPRQKWDASWTVYQADANGTVHVRRGETYRQAMPGSYAVRGGGMPQVGSVVDLSVELYQDSIQSGWLYWTGWKADSDYDAPATARFYLNTSADTAPEVVSTVIAALDGYGLPFRMKTLAAPEGYTRADSTVVYLPRRHAALAQRLILDAVSGAGLLQDETPLFALPLAPGISFADDPADGSSFGQSRVRLVAAGLLDAWFAGTQETGSRLIAIAERFGKSGMSLGQPHLGAGTQEIAPRADLPVQGTTLRRAARPAFTLPTNDPATRATAYVEGAAEIGRQLCRDAVWSGDTAGWTGWAIHVGPGGVAPAYRASGPLLYDGAAGIGMFLADLAAMTGDAIAAETALGAMNAVSGIAEEHDAKGLYTGVAGMAWTLLQVGERLSQDTLIERGLTLMEQVAKTEFEATDFDYLGGSAGVISTLLDVAARHNRPDFATEALRIARTLAEGGQTDARGLSWPGPIDAAHNLLGFGHGAAGPAVSLMEAATVFGDDTLAQASDAAMAYERSWFDAGQQAWPDFRLDTTQGQTRENHQSAYAPTWCNGSVGIAVSRLRLLEMRPGDPDLLREVDAGLQHLGRYLATTVNPQGADLCMCHGTVEAAETVLLASQILGREDISVTAHQVGAWLIDNYVRTEAPFPCGVMQAGEAPGMMMGLAGIGQFLLRLADQEVQTPLILRPDLAPVAKADARAKPRKTSTRTPSTNRKTSGRPK